MFDFTAFPVLSTERLLLRELVPGDAEDVFVFRSDTEVQQYNSEAMTHVSQALTLIYQLMDGYYARESICWGVALREENRVIGLFTINKWNVRHRHAEIGYDLARAYWGYGIATEALAAMLSFCFDEMGFNHVEADTLEVNAASIRLLERLGFRREGTRRGYILEDDGLYYDSAIYALLRQEYYSA